MPKDAAEVRRVTLTNNGDETREIELTSYGEIVLAPRASDRVHPAFSNLFVETEWHEWCHAITAARRPRSAEETPLWCAHVLDTGPQRVGEVSFETDRARFLGRGRSTRVPQALAPGATLSGTTGAVLDPIFAIRTRVRLSPGQSASVAFTTLVADVARRALRAHRPLPPLERRRSAPSTSRGPPRRSSSGSSASPRPMRRPVRTSPATSSIPTVRRARRAARPDGERGVAADALDARDLRRLARGPRHDRRRRRTPLAAGAPRRPSLLAAPRRERGPRGRERRAAELRAGPPHADHGAPPRDRRLDDGGRVRRRAPPEPHRAR